MRHFLWGERRRGERVWGSRCPVVGGLVGGCALQVVGMGRQVLVLGMTALVRALSSMLTHSRALETHGGRRHGLSISRRLLLGLELTHRGFMRTLLWWDGVSVWAHLCSVLGSDARVHLRRVGGYVVGLLVLWVSRRQRGLWRSLLVGHCVGWRLHGAVS